MSTPAYIAQIRPDGTGQRILLSMDGYPTWAGVKLLLHYSSQERVRDLIDLGPLLTLGDNPEHQEGAFIDEYGRWDTCDHPTRAFGREGHPHYHPHQPERVSGGLQGVCPPDEYNFQPWTYVWTPDGWFGADPEESAPQRSFVPLLTLIHAYHRDKYEDCEAGEAMGPYMVKCSKHSHGISLLQPLLPGELLPEDPDHPTYRLAHAFPAATRAIWTLAETD